jgi:hypothetical protein
MKFLDEYRDSATAQKLAFLCHRLRNDGAGQRAVASFCIQRIQETHETLLHILLDLIHVIRGQEDVS